MIGKLVEELRSAGVTPGVATFATGVEDGETVIVVECRHCGTTLDQDTVECPYCGPTDTVKFEI